ncbi:MAG: ABC transporter ATP-binding protein [Chloroflexi bacterium]|nr:ABC transporter ATP-binding protein [Chloroflexota bacterium]MCI0580669.1 ABC transporter ATP-binding protein [Chloroflexota bacterium]MCI0648685.1 ABC transporter ATP-binding protein [Chloroflexota bacterium]MCI0728093.1 ABC transporter ATP-binding protein [Chloroflexota bacterium]
MSETPALEARGLTKRFPGVLANDAVDLTLLRGEVLALLGENGAGKTTLMNMLYGLYHPDEGEILVNGKPIVMNSPSDAIAAGIGMVHQHFMLVQVMTVTENIMLGVEETRGALSRFPLVARLNRRKAADRIRQLSKNYNLALDPNDVIKDLPVGIQQRVEIIKALYRLVDILILDEPTAVLTPQETEEFFAIIRNLTAQGTSIIFISHKLKEVLAIADRITVLHRGRVVGTALPKEATEASLAEMMVGRKVILQVEKSEAHPGQPVLQVEELVVRDERGNVTVNGVSLEARAGEILGIAGVQGNGQRELVEGLTGLRPVVSGRVFVNGQETTHARPRTITELGVAHIPEDREKHGLVMAYPVADNMVLNRYYQTPFANGPVLDHRAIEAHGQALVKKYDVRTPSVRTPAGSLSGGNKQKVIVAREFSRPVKLLIANQPTRGIDVGSIEFIHQQIVNQRDSGSAVLLVSAELDEILSLADRVAVMFEGRIVKTLPIAEATRERLGLLMAGAAA